MDFVFARSAQDVRRLAVKADAVLIDATEDHAQAIDAFSLALTQLGAARTTLYTEQLHEGLEPFVRMQGALLLLGPLKETQWEDFWQRTAPEGRQRRSWKKAA
jgi:hypothetical protein